MRYRVIRQHDAMQCGAACLLTVCHFYGRHDISLEQMAEMCGVDKTGVSLYALNVTAQRIGFETRCVTFPLIHLQDLDGPCILYWNACHFVVFFQVRGGRYIIGDPARGLVECSEAEVSAAWLTKGDDGVMRGIALMPTPAPDFLRRDASPAQSMSLWRTLPSLWAYVRPHRRALVQLAAGLALGCLVQFVMPFLAQAVVDVGIGLRDVGSLYVLVIAQMALMLGRAAAGFFRSWIILRVGAGVNIAMVSDFLVKLIRLPMTFFDKKLTGDILQRMADYSRIRDFFTTQALDALFAIFSIAIFALILGTYSVSLLAVFLVGSVAHLVWIALFMRRRRALDYEIFRLQSISSNKTLECVSSLQEIKLQGCGERRRSEWVAAQEALVNAQAQSLALSQRQEAGGVIISEAKNVLMTLCSAMAVLSGDMTMGMMLATQYIAGQLVAPIQSLMRFAYAAQDVRISLERIVSLNHLPDEDDARDARPDDVDIAQGIEFQDVTYSYSSPDGEDPAVDSVSLSIPAGKVTAIVGASGSGKTTLIKLLLGFFLPQKGHILVGGANLATLPTEWWRGQCGTVMQDGVLFSDSVTRNIATADPNPDPDKVQNAARLACANDFISTMPTSYATQIGTEGQQLSKGQTQRILIARAIYRDPSLLIMDEATNSLDTVTEASIVHNLSDFCAGRTTIVIAHRLSTVRGADQIVVMDHGRIVEQGNHDSLIAQRGYYFKLIENQLNLDP